MTCSSDPGGTVDVDPDVTPVRDDRLPCVHAHSHADRARLERGPPIGSRGERVRGFGEGDEERVPLRVHLHATVPAEAFAQRLAVLTEHVRVGIAKLVQQPR